MLHYHVLVLDERAIIGGRFERLSLPSVRDESRNEEFLAALPGQWYRSMHGHLLSQSKAWVCGEPQM